MVTFLSYDIDPQNFIFQLGSYGADFNYTIVYSDERGASALTTLADVILSGNDVTLRFFADHQPEPNVDTKIHLTLNEVSLPCSKTQSFVSIVCMLFWP